MVRSIAKPKSVAAGQTPTNVDYRLHDLLNTVVRQAQRMKSDYIRSNAEIVAMAASMQLITTRVSKGTYAQAWRITTKGLTHIEQRDND